MITTHDVSSVAPLSHADAVRLQGVEIERAVHLLAALGPDDWSARTDCPDWDVRQMYLHVLGACEAGASLAENLRQMRRAMRRRRRAGGPLEAALSGVQVEERAHLEPSEIVERLRTVGPRTVAKRASMPGPMRSLVRMKVDGPVVETWRLGYLVGPIYLRDLWMHRIDLCRATGRAPELTAAHDGVIVADVVAEWARRHGQPFALHLTGPAGGAFRTQADGPSVELDAVEFCRTLAGRVPADGLLATIVPF